MNKVVKMNLEDIIGERFGRYSRYIIQDRALPDVRDGLKPVQRRILYAMYTEGNTYKNAYRKSAKTVGNVIGNYHPHGDTSVYDAMVRMSQDWKLAQPLIDMHGNNGSVDGDSAAAMRYTEARMSLLAEFLLKDIKSNTVPMVYNFDDTLYEPTVLPAKFPNLLVNGSTGISSGYATNIPPHNLNEMLDACVATLKGKSKKEVLANIAGPDFPTGGIVSGREQIEEALTTGRGRVVLKSRYSIEKVNKKNAIVVTEIPYEINKAMLVYKIMEIKELKKVDGINDVRDESDRDGTRIVIELKADANNDLILKYLLKNTDLQVYYNYNMVAIIDRKPKQVSVFDILDNFLTFNREILVTKAKFDLDKNASRMHIIEGLIKALSILDEVIALIRASQSKKDAIANLENKFDFTNLQAEAIVNLQLYRLTNTDIVELTTEAEQLKTLIANLESLISDEKVQTKALINQFLEIKKMFDTPRRTSCEDTIETIKINTQELIKNEEVVIGLSADGYIKKLSMRVYSSNIVEEYKKKDDDYLIMLQKAYEHDKLLVFLSSGNYLVIPLHDLSEEKWKDLGQHLASYVSILSQEKILFAKIITNFDSQLLYAVTKEGYAKQFNLSELEVSRFTKSYTYMKLVDDEVISVGDVVDASLVLVTANAYALKYTIDELPIQGAKSRGVTAIKLVDDKLIYAGLATSKYVLLTTSKNCVKKLPVELVVEAKRARKGNLVISTKDKTIKFINGISSVNKQFGLRLDDKVELFDVSSVANHGVDKVGSKVSDHIIINICNVVDCLQEVENSIKKSEITSVKEEECDIIEENITINLTIDDLLD